MAEPVVLALDIGTSSVRASLYRATLQPTASHGIRSVWKEFPDGRVEGDPLRLERLVIGAIDGVLRRRKAPVAAVVVGTFWHSLMALDASDRPLSPLIPWSDVRADMAATLLRSRLDERRIHAVTGCRLHASYWPARLVWFREHEPKVFARAAAWVTFGEWIERRWLGRRAISVSQASGTGLMQQDTCSWDPTLLRVCEVDRDRIAPIVDVDAAGATLVGRLKRRWPALAGARWLPALGDGALNNVGAGCVTRNRAALMIGTSGAMRVLWEPGPGESVETSFGLWRYRLDRRRVVVGGALSNGGNVREWVLRTFCTTSRTEARALAMPPASHGLTMLPFLAGTRSPDYRPNARGVIAGLSLATTPEHVLRAALEAIAYRFGVVYEELKDVTRVREIVAAGGALERSSGWAQIVADVLGRRISLCAARELTSRGAAAVGFEHLGLLVLGHLAPPRSSELVPNTRHHQLYRGQISILESAAELLDRTGVIGRCRGSGGPGR
jgi:gluconokinase